MALRRVTMIYDYEFERQKIIEENRKRMHELGLDVLMLLGPKASSPAVRKPSGCNDATNAGGHIEKRRSTRIASSPRVDYAENRIRPPKQSSQASHTSTRSEALQLSHSSARSKALQLSHSSARREALQLPRSSARRDTLQLSRSSARSEAFPLSHSRLHRDEPQASRSTVKRKSLKRGMYAAAEMKAEDALRAQGERDYPFFVKGMLKSHISGGFWLGLPSDFCATYFHKDEYVILEDEDLNQWECKYLHHKHGLSGGWRGFSLDHHLLDGDALLFELVNKCVFKVQIKRARGFGEPASMRYALSESQDYESMAKGRVVNGDGIQRPRKRMAPMVRPDSGGDVKPKLRKMLKNTCQDSRALAPLSSRMKLQDAVKLEIATDFPEVKSETSEVYVSPSQKRQHYSYCRLARLPKAISVGDFARPSKTRMSYPNPLPSKKHYYVHSDDCKPLRVK